MPLDGSLQDRFTGERCNRRLRPATAEYASANFPRLIIKLKQGRLLISVDRAVEHSPVFTLRDRKDSRDWWRIVEADFLAVKEIAADVRLNIFPGESLRSTEDRIRAIVEVEFAGRGIPT